VSFPNRDAFTKVGVLLLQASGADIKNNNFGDVTCEVVRLQIILEYSIFAEKLFCYEILVARFLFYILFVFFCHMVFPYVCLCCGIYVMQEIL
jgi:hypothetical protein